MPGRFALTAVAVVTASGLLAGCASRPEPPVAEPETGLGEPVLTAERAREALLERMRGKPAGDFGRFDPDEWAKVEVRAGEDGWYDFGGLFRIHPAKRAYTMLILPAPDAKACAFHYEGAFAVRDGRWVAGPPELVKTALQAGR
jgi:hypothetical protein